MSPLPDRLASDAPPCRGTIRPPTPRHPRPVEANGCLSLAHTATPPASPPSACGHKPGSHSRAVAARPLLASSTAPASDIPHDPSGTAAGSMMPRRHEPQRGRRAGGAPGAGPFPAPPSRPGISAVLAQFGTLKQMRAKSPKRGAQAPLRYGGRCHVGASPGAKGGHLGILRHSNASPETHFF